MTAQFYLIQVLAMIAFLACLVMSRADFWCKDIYGRSCKFDSGVTVLEAPVQQEQEPKKLTECASSCNWIRTNRWRCQDCDYPFGLYNKNQNNGKCIRLDNMLDTLDEDPRLMDKLLRQCQSKTKANCKCVENPKFGLTGDDTVVRLDKRTTSAFPIVIYKKSNICQYKCLSFFRSNRTTAEKIIRESLVHHRIFLSGLTFRAGKCGVYIFQDPANSSMTYKEFRSIRRFCKREGIKIALKSGKYKDKIDLLMRILDRDTRNVNVIPIPSDQVPDK